MLLESEKTSHNIIINRLMLLVDWKEKQQCESLKIWAAFNAVLSAKCWITSKSVGKMGTCNWRQAEHSPSCRRPAGMWTEHTEWLQRSLGSAGLNPPSFGPHSWLWAPELQQHWPRLLPAASTFPDGSKHGQHHFYRPGRVLILRQLVPNHVQPLQISKTWRLCKWFASWFLSHHLSLS